MALPVRKAWWGGSCLLPHWGLPSGCQATGRWGKVSPSRPHPPAGGGSRIPVPFPPHFTSWVQTAPPSSGHLPGQDLQAGPEAAWRRQPWLAGPRAMGAGLFPAAVWSPQGGVLKEKVCKPHMECCTWSILRGHQSISPPPPRHPGLCPSSFPLSIGRATSISIRAIWGDAGKGFSNGGATTSSAFGTLSGGFSRGLLFRGWGAFLDSRIHTSLNSNPSPPTHTQGAMGRM